MPLLREELSLWEIGFRWAGYDPDRPRLMLPLETKDYFRLLMEAILSGELLCETLTLAKQPTKSKSDPQYYIRSHIDEIYACIGGKRYNRALLKWAQLSRSDFKEWCDRRGIALPEFWFPSGWKSEFEMPEGGTLAMWAEHIEPDYENGFSIRHKHPLTGKLGDSEVAEKPITLSVNQQVRAACQQIALNIWKEDISRTIPSIVESELIQKYGGGAHFNNETVKGWIKKVAPPEVKSRAGRPRKKRG